MSLYTIVRNASIEVDETSMQRKRTRSSVLASGMAEFGELAEEVAIEEKFSYKKPGADGIVGEAVDVIACMLDIIYVHNPNITEEELNHLMELKCRKWVEKASKKRA